MHILFEGSSIDIYIHWLIFWLGILVIVFGAAVLFSCRSIAIVFKLLGPSDSRWSKFYQKFYRFHSTYWIIFGISLALHLLVTITHVGFPENPFLAAHIMVFITAITNFILTIVVLSSCNTVAKLINYLTSGNFLNNKRYKSFYSYHSYYWWLLGISLVVHIVFGMIHAINT